MRHMGLNELASDWRNIQMTNEAEERIMERLRAEHAEMSKGHSALMAIRSARWVSTLLTAFILLLVSAGIGVYLSHHATTAAASLAKVQVYGPRHPSQGPSPRFGVFAQVSTPNGDVSKLDVDVTLLGTVHQSVEPVFIVVESADNHTKHIYPVTNETTVLQHNRQTYHLQVPVPGSDGEYYVYAKSSTFPTSTRLADIYQNDVVMYIEHVKQQATEQP